MRNVVHGTTLVTNAIIERKGAKTALLTTRGFRDVIEIGKESRYDVYDIFLELPKPLVPRRLRREVDERVLDDGSVFEPLDLDGVEREVEQLRGEGVEAIAVCLLHSYKNPDHERAVAERVRTLAPEIHLSISSEVAPAIREYERASTTIANVYVRPMVDAYLDRLEHRLEALGFSGRLLIMLSSGAVCTVETARNFPGPADRIRSCRGRPGCLVLRRSNGPPQSALLRHGRYHRQGLPDRRREADDDS